MSFIKMLKSNGPKTEPQGTPEGDVTKSNLKEILILKFIIFLLPNFS